MSALEWYPRYSAKALEGMRGLSLELRGAYNTLLDMIYERGAPVPDDDRLLAGYMGVSVRRWRQLRQALFDKGRIVLRETPRGPALSDELAERELASRDFRQRVASESGANGGRKNGENRKISNENSKNDQGCLKQPYKGALSDRHNSSESKDSERQSALDGREDLFASAPPAASIAMTAEKQVWRSAVELLKTQGRMSERGARSFFAKMLRDHGVKAAELEGAIEAARENATLDPQGYLVKAASRVGKGAAAHWNELRSTIQ